VAIQKTVDHEQRIVFFTVTGTLETDEMLDAVKETFAQRKPGAIYDVVSDHREVTEPARPEQIKSLVAELQKLANTDGMRAAMIVATDASYGMMRMMAAHIEMLGIEVGIFRDPAEARAFIDRRASA
jgi:hypothetical protein